MTQVVGASAAYAAALPFQSSVLFSSTSAVWSQPGAGHYAAANAYLDGLAAGRQRAGLPATAVQFGPFGGTGMATGHAAALSALGLHGLRPHQASPNNHLALQRIRQGGWQCCRGDTVPQVNISPLVKLRLPLLTPVFTARQTYGREYTAIIYTVDVLACLQAWDAAVLAGPLPHLVYASMDRARFAAVNTAKGPWALLQTLSSVRQDSIGLVQRQPALEATPAQATLLSAPVKAALPLDAVAKVVRDVAASVLGADAAEGDYSLVCTHAITFSTAERARLSHA